MTNLRWRVLTILAVLVTFASVGVYPIVAAHYRIHSPAFLIEKQLKLGLDLQGGVHLVLRVQTDDALRLTTETRSEALRESLTKSHVPFSNIVVASPTQFRVEGVAPANAAAVRQTAAELSDFDVTSATGGAFVFTMKPNVQVKMRDDTVVQARQTIERRVNELGVSEPSIAIQGANQDEILVQLPGVTDIDKAKSIIQSTARLEFKLVEAGPSSSKDTLLQNGQVPPGDELLPGAPNAPGESPETVYYLVKRVPVVSGTDIRNARATVDEYSQPAVGFSLSQAGGQKFSKATSENVGRLLAIVLDGRVQSAPKIDERIGSEGRIHGNFTQEDVQNLSLLLRSGALPASLTYLEERTVGPSLGADSIRSGVIASLVGLALIVFFMLFYYRLSGVNAVIALIFNLIILLGLMAYVGAVMTLPGIAGFVLTMGIGVDSNVLIFERIKEELEAQRGVRAAINAGFSRVFVTLLDTHISALIAAAFLFQFGTGPIRGFAVTLSVGLLSNLFTSTFVSKTLFEVALARRQQVAALSI